MCCFKNNAFWFYAVRVALKINAICFKYIFIFQVHIVIFTLVLLIVLLHWYCLWYRYLALLHFVIYKFSTAGIRSRGPLATVSALTP